MTQACRDGKDTIQTRYMFSAITRLKPGHLPELLNLLPPKSLPSLINNDTGTEKVILRRDVHVSHCISDSFDHLGKKVSEEMKLSSADIFVDLAQYGTGHSVAQFREYGVTAKKIEELITTLGWQIVRR